MYALLTELYNVSGAEIIWQTKDKQFIDVLIEETIELRKSPEDKKKERQKFISEAVDSVISQEKEVKVIDPITGESKTIDLTIFQK